MTPALKRRLPLTVAALALAFLSLLVGRRSQQAAPPSTVPAIDNPGPQGLEAAYRYLAHRQQVQLLDASFESLSPSTRVLLTALPQARPVEETEQRAVLAWVERGGTLVVLGDHARSLGGVLQGVLDLPVEALRIEGREPGLSDLGRDVKALLDAAARQEPEDQILALPVVTDPLLAGVQALSVSAGRGFAVRSGPAVPLVVGGDTALMLGLSRGAGRIVVLAGADVLTNARLDQAGNLQLLANLGGLGPVAFDEFHHRPAPAAAAGELARALGPALLAIVLWLLTVVAVGLRRLGPPRAAPRTPPASTRDYALQLGGLYQRAGAGPHLARTLAGSLRASLRGVTLLPATATDQALVDAMESWPATWRDEARGLLQRLATPGPLRPIEYLALVQRTVRLQQTIERGLLTAPQGDPILEARAAARSHPDPHGGSDTAR
jgi:hypothetical protein